jgi:hypothetical protein
MGRCRCGAALVPDLHFCVACGARQDLAGRVPVAAGARYAGPVSHGPVSRGPVSRGPVSRGPVSRGPGPAPAGLAQYSPPRPIPYVAAPTYGPGAPARSTVPWIVAGVSVVVAVVLVAVGVLAARPAAVVTPTPVVTPTMTVGVPVPVAASSERGSDGVSSSSSGSTSTSASSALAAQVASDRPIVEGLVGPWVPQLSAKRDGLVADGITYDDDAILAHWSTLTSRDPSAVMLFSGDWPVFNGSDFWVVVHPQGFATAAAANAWCDAQGYAADDCYAKKLSHSGGPSGTTVTRH